MAGPGVSCSWAEPSTPGRLSSLASRWGPPGVSHQGEEHRAVSMIKGTLHGGHSDVSGPCRPPGPFPFCCSVHFISVYAVGLTCLPWGMASFLVTHVVCHRVKTLKTRTGMQWSGAPSASCFTSVIFQNESKLGIELAVSSEIQLYAPERKRGHGGFSWRFSA